MKAWSAVGDVMLCIKPEGLSVTQRSKVAKTACTGTAVTRKPTWLESALAMTRSMLLSVVNSKEIGRAHV